MITEAEIQQIDYTSNSCIVRIPFFETVNTAENVIVEAKFAVMPGICHGYVVGDVVWVAFENGMAGKPIVIGKVFKSLEDESKSRSAIYCDSLTTNKEAIIPGTTKISNVDNNYGTIQKIINKLKTLIGDPTSVYDISIVVQPNELADGQEDKEITLHLSATQAYNANNLETFKKNLYLAGYTSIDKFKAVSSDESAICGLFATKENDGTYKLYYVTSWANTMTASGYLIQDWNQSTGLMTLSSAQFAALLNVEPHHSYELENSNIKSINCMEVSLL